MRPALSVRTAIILAAATLCGGLSACSSEEEYNTQAPAPEGFTPPTTTSRLDWGSAAERRFQQLDRDHDGAVTEIEWPRADSERFAERDTDKDGRITSIEWGEGAIRRFDALDLNRDGSVTTDERRQAEGRRR